MLGTAAIGAMLAAMSPQVAVADRRELRFDAFATPSPFAAFGFFSADGHGPEGRGVEIGVGVAASRRFGRRFDLGLGLRYDFARDDEDRVHLVAAPITAALVFPIGTERELRAGVGLGPGFGVAPGYADDGDSALLMLGASGELAFAFAQGIHSDGLDLALQLGARLDVLPELNADPGGYHRGGQLIHIQLPFVRAGMTWR